MYLKIKLIALSLFLILNYFLKDRPEQTLSFTKVTINQQVSARCVARAYVCFSAGDCHYRITNRAHG